MPRPSKLDPYVHLLGTRSDASVAALAGVTPEAARIYRTRRGIPSVRDAAQDDDLPPEPGETVEPTPDEVSAVAEPTEAPARERVRRRRGAVVEEVDGPVIQAAPEPAPERAASSTSISKAGRKSAEALLEPFRDQLGQVDDGKIAEMAGLSRGVVGAYRRKHGIKAYDGYLWTTGGEGGGRARRGEQVGGVASESEARPAAKAKPPVSKTKTKRKKAMPSTQASRKTEGTPAPAGAETPKRRGPPSKLDAVRDLVGVLGDAEVAARVGLTRSAVQMYRHKHGIPAPTKRGPTTEAVGAAIERPAARAEVAEAPLVARASATAPEPVVTVAAVAEPAPAPRPLAAWRLTLRVGGVEVERYAITADSASVARLGDAAGEVLRIERVGEVLV